MKNKEKGITLTALVVTIIVMLILAIISVNATIGENGIINKTFKSKISKEKQDASTDVIEGIKRIEYYANASADKGVTLKGLLKTLNLEKYTNGKIHGIKTDGNNTIIYYSNNIGSYTITVDENGGTKTELGIVVKKNEVNNVEMAQDEKITLTSDEEISYWVVAGGDVDSVEINSITGEVIKKGEGTVVIYGYKSKEDAETGQYLEVTIKDKKEEMNSIAQTGDGDEDEQIILEHEEITSEVYPGIPGPDYIGYLKIGDHSYIYIKDTNDLITLHLYVDNFAEGVVDVYDKYKNGITFEDVHYYVDTKINCEDVKKIIIEDSVKEVPDNIFNNFTNTYQLSLPKGLTRLGKIVDEINSDGEAHKGLINLEELDYACEIPNLNMHKDDKNWALYIYTNSTEFANIGSCIGGKGFFDFKYTKLKSIVFKDTVKNIPSEIFSHCNYLKKVFIGKNVESIGNNAFLNCINLTDIEYETESSINNIKLIGLYAFSFTGIDNIINSNQITTIKHGTYYACKNIKTLDIPSNIFIIEQLAFSYCIELKSLRFNNGIKEIGNSAFSGCNNLEHVTFNLINSLKKIGYYCFSNCFELVSFQFPDSIENIGERTFSGDKKLELLKFPKNLNIIEESICEECHKLQNIIWPETDFEISDLAFRNCQSLTNISIPNVTKIGVGSFGYCYKVESLSLGYKCKEICERAFECCYKLNNITFETLDSRLGRNYKRKSISRC